MIIPYSTHIPPLRLGIDSLILSLCSPSEDHHRLLKAKFSAERWRSWGTQEGATTGSGTCGGIFRYHKWRPRCLPASPGVVRHAVHAGNSCPIAAARPAAGNIAGCMRAASQ